MFISDFAIKRPIITDVVDARARRVRHLRAHAAATPTSSRTCRTRWSSSRCRIRARRPTPSSARSSIRIEEAISGISGVDKIQSNSLDSFGVIITFFQFEKDLQEATQEIRDKISEIRNDLPPEMEEPILTRFNPADLPIVSLTLSSTTLTGPELTRLADPDITRRLRGIPGVAEVEVVGGIERELTVELRPRDLQAAGVSVAQVVQALQAQNLAAPVGRLNGELDERTIRLRGRLETPADFAQLPIAQSQRPRRPARRRRRRARRHRGAALRRASSTARRRSASTSRSRRATARRRSPTLIRDQVEEIQPDAARRA